MVAGAATLWKERREWLRFLKTSYWIPTIFLIVVASLSLLFAALDPPLGIPIEGFNEIKKFRYFFVPLFGAVLLLSVTEKEQSTLESGSFWRVLFWTTILVSLIGAFQFWAGYIFGDTFIRETRIVPGEAPQYIYPRFFRGVAGTLHTHAHGLMFFHLSFASAISFSLNYLCARVLWPEVKDSFRDRCVFGAALILTAFALYFTYSRTAWLVLIVAPCFLAFLRKPKWGVVLLSTFVVAMVALWFSSHAVRQRFLDAPGWLGRYHVWASSWEMVKDRPWLGVGFGKSGQYTDHYAERFLGGAANFSSHAHNNILDAWATTGTLGMLAYLFWFGLLGYFAWRLYCRAPLQKRWLPAALLGSWLAFQTNGLTQVNFYDGKSQHSLMFWAALVLALWWRESDPSKNLYQNRLQRDE